jgi:hypothetical protein
MGAIRRSPGFDAKPCGTPLILDAMGESAPHRRGTLAGPIDCRVWLAVRECSMGQIDRHPARPGISPSPLWPTKEDNKVECPLFSPR